MSYFMPTDRGNQRIQKMIDKEFGNTIIGDIVSVKSSANKVKDRISELGGTKTFQAAKKPEVVKAIATAFTEKMNRYGFAKEIQKACRAIIEGRKE